MSWHTVVLVLASSICFLIRNKTRDLFFFYPMFGFISSFLQSQLSLLADIAVAHGEKTTLPINTVQWNTWLTPSLPTGLSLYLSICWKPGEEDVSRLQSAVLVLVNITTFGKWIPNRNLLTFTSVSVSYPSSHISSAVLTWPVLWL